MNFVTRILLFPALLAFTTGVATQVTFAASTEPATKVAQTEKKKKKRDPGKRLYMRNTCIACHGKDGKRAIMDYPNLAGQDQKYMIQQFKHILSGKRTGSPDATGNPRSAGMRGALVSPEGVARLTKDEIKQITSWLAKQEPAKPKAPKQEIDPDRIKQGAALYKKKCKSCHGKEGKKPLKGYPYVAGQKSNYLITQITDIRDKKRTSGKSKLMVGMVKKLTDEQIATVADYLSQIDRTAK